MSDLTFKQDQSHLNNVGAATGAAGYLASGGGLGAMSGFVTQTKDASGNKHTEWDMRALASSSLQFGAAAAGGAAAFSSAAGPFGAFVGTGLSVLATGVQGGFTAWDSQKCINLLDNLATVAEREGFVELAENINWIIGKQKVKRNKGAANASLVGQPAKQIYNAVKGIHKLRKGTKGVNRAEKADYFIKTAQKTDREGELARQVIQNVVKEDFEKFLRTSLANAFKSG